MTIAMAREVELSPMFWACVRQQPVDTSGVDSAHFLDFVIEGFSADGTCGFVEEFFERRVFELFMKVVVKVSKAISMRTTREYALDGFEKAFLVVRDKGELSMC